MGLKNSFEDLQKESLEQLKSHFSSTPLHNQVQGLTNLTKKDHDFVLTSIIYSFTKTSLVDRDFDPKEKKEVAKRVSRFLNLEEATLVDLINQAEKDLKGVQGRSSDFVASFFIYLGKKANEKTRHKIFRYLGNIIASDNEVVQEERYLIELVGKSFGLSDIEISECLITADLMGDIAEEQEFLTEVKAEAEAQKTNDAPPVIKFDLN